MTACGFSTILFHLANIVTRQDILTMMFVYLFPLNQRANL